MTTFPARVSLVLLAIIALGGCEDEPLSPVATGNAPSAEEPAPALAVRGGPRDHAAIQEIVSTFDAAWTAGDHVRYAAQYAGAEWVGPDGRILTDPAAITGVYAFVIGVLFRETVRQSTIRGLTFLTGTIAVLDISTQVTDDGAVVARALEKNVLVKRAGEWRIVQHQQVIVAPPS